VMALWIFPSLLATERGETSERRPANSSRLPL